MIEVTFDDGAIRSFARGWSGGHRKAVVSAFKAEAFRLMRVTQDFLRGGVGPPKAPLTRLEAKRRGPQALAALAPMVAYEVNDTASGPEAVIGFSAQTGRRKRPLPLGMLEFVTGGGTVTITREHQARIAQKLRRRGRSERTIRRAIPKVGTTVTFPERDWATEVSEAERENSARNLAALYQAKLEGQRWARVWWTDTPGRIVLQEHTRTVVR